MHTKILIFIFVFVSALIAGSANAQTLEDVDPSVFGAPESKGDEHGGGTSGSAGTADDGSNSMQLVAPDEEYPISGNPNDPDVLMQGSGDDAGIVQHNQTDIDFLNERGSPVSVQAVQVRGWDPEKKKEFLGTVKTHAELQSGQDLENFATGVLLADENMEDVAVSEKEVLIAYRMPAKLFGIFEREIKADISVRGGSVDNTQGRVKVRFPWYRFFYSISDAVRQGSLETDIETSISSLTEEQFQNTIQVQARLFQTISNVLKTRHETAMNSIRNMK